MARADIPPAPKLDILVDGGHVPLEIVGPPRLIVALLTPQTMGGRRVGGVYVSLVLPQVGRAAAHVVAGGTRVLHLAVRRLFMSLRKGEGGSIY
jgi:hypothetical protein